MNNKLSDIKLVLAVLLLISSLSCRSLEKQTSENSSNILVNNVNSNTNVSVNRNIANLNTNASVNQSTVAEKPRDPKEICAWLPEFTPAEYKLFTGGTYSCKSLINEGKSPYWRYQAFGGASNIKNIELFLAVDKGPDAKKEVQRFVKLAETLWRKAFAEPLPNEIKNELLAAKAENSSKDFNEPVRVTINHAYGESGGHGIEFRFYLSKPK